MDPSVPNWGPKLDVVLIVFFINPCDPCKASPTKYRLSELSIGFSPEGIFCISFLTSLWSKVKAKRSFQIQLCASSLRFV